MARAQSRSVARGELLSGESCASFEKTSRYLATADLPRLDVFCAKLEENFVERLLETLGPLRQLSIASALSNSSAI